MKKEFINIPQYTTIEEILKRDFTLSATQYKSFCIKNQNQVEVRDLLVRNLNRSDMGIEVGSEAYVDVSDYTFIKTKSLQQQSFLPDESRDATEFISPKFFVSTNLKKGDLLISKDSNVGEIIILDKDYPKAMTCSGIYKLPIVKNKYYFLAFAKSDLFRQQIDFLVPRGATIRHGKTKFLDCKIPFPNSNVDETIKYVETLTKSIVEKEIKIREKYKFAMAKIDKELKNNQKTNPYIFSLPTINEIIDLDRMDSCLYSDVFKENEFYIRNYLNGYKTIHELGFEISRGQNLQVSNIGKSIQVKEKREAYYTLILPKFLSKYGTINEVEYLGNNMTLKTLKVGDIIFGAEGNEKGRSLVILNEKENTITNIHGITLNQNSDDKTKSIFVKLFLDYYRSLGMIDAYAVGGNGGSMAIKYWNYLKFPNFPDLIEQDIVSLYYSQKEFNPPQNSIDDFEKYDALFNELAGIYELDLAKRKLQNLLDKCICNISDDIPVDVKFY